MQALQLAGPEAFRKPCSLQSLSQVTQIICVFGFSSKLLKLVEKLAELLGLQGCTTCMASKIAGF